MSKNYEKKNQRFDIFNTQFYNYIIIYLCLKIG
jgi:hypothetical protein